MPHQCVRCGDLYEDGNKAILTGCSCGGKLFFFIRKEKYEKLKAQQQGVGVEDLSDKEKVELEKEVYEILGDQAQRDEPVVLDFESINVLKPGKYEVDLISLFRKEPLIFKLSDGKYMIDLPNTFKEFRNK